MRHIRRMALQAIIRLPNEVRRGTRMLVNRIKRRPQMRVGRGDLDPAGRHDSLDALPVNGAFRCRASPRRRPAIICDRNQNDLRARFSLKLQ